MFVVEIQLRIADLSAKGGKKMRPKSSVVSLKEESFMFLCTIGVSYILSGGALTCSSQLYMMSTVNSVTVCL